jgi:aminoglycoside phosphotransferase (APT) family kinase protein
VTGRAAPSAGTPGLDDAGPDAGLVARLRTVLDDGERLTGVRRLSDGHSNDTYVLLGLDLVLRAPPAGPGLMPAYDIPAQYRILRALGDAEGAPPVPRVHALYEDPSLIGRPFFLMERVAGGSTDWSAPPWLAEPPDSFRDQLSRRWCAAVAAVHHLPVEVIGGPVRTPPDEARFWLELARDADAPAALIEVLGDLAAHPPRTSGLPTPVHGDTKFANCLWTEDGELTAMLDWEFSHVGEPLVDLGYLVGLWPAAPDEPGQMPYTKLGGWWDRTRFIAEWEALTGRTAVDLGWYEQLGMALIGTIFARGIALFRSGQSTDQRLARWDRSLEVWLRSMARRAEWTAP